MLWFVTARWAVVWCAEVCFGGVCCGEFWSAAVGSAIKEGWKASFDVMCNLPEYIRPNDLHDTLVNAGRLVGLGDFRPSYGRFLVTSFDHGMAR